jgi:hypothetical protein
LEKADAAQTRLFGLLHRLDFARRWYELCAAARVGTPCRDLSAEEQAAALATTGRTFRFKRRESFFAFRETGVPGELGVNLSLRDGVAEFILVLRAPAGHIGGPFSGMMRHVERRFGPVLPETPPYPQPWYQGATELRQLLAVGFELYAEVAAAVLAGGLLAGIAPDAEPDTPA